MASQNFTPPLPSNYVDAIRESTKELREAQNIQVTDDAVKRLLFSPSFIQTFRRVSNNHGLHFPLKFPSILSELNFLSVLCLLNFASGYRVPLHEQTGRGAWDNIRALVFGMYLSSATGQGDLLTAKGMRTITPQQIAELMSVKIYVERSHETLPGVTVGELGGHVYDLVKLISTTLNETGEILERSGMPDFGSFVLRSLTSKRSGGSDVTVDDILKDLACAFPAFRDMAVVDGRPVYCFKKALFFIHALTLRFGSSSPPPFSLPDTAKVPVFTDNVLPSLLIHLGVLDLSGAKDAALRSIFPDAANDTQVNTLLAVPKDTPGIGTAVVPGIMPRTTLPKDGPVVTSDQAYILRAAAVDACEKIVEHAHRLDETSLSDGQKWIKDIKLPELDVWLWAVAKDRSDYRELGRFVLRDTVFF
ncbi:hypothetical protein J3R82DRAFT_10470 [Butyriboletus roseoflavus]|nr:hypothetical protein J3R82DRAFT_10470 [Butyriboletus roseoflavus]